MFTGLVECEGVITRAERVSGGMRLEVYAPEFGRDMAIGDSIAVDGVCLTVVKFIRGAFLTDVSSETLERSTLGSVRQGSKVNLERALRLSDRLGGHLVSGHIDGMGSMELRQPNGKFSVYQFGAPAEIMDYIVEKGSVAVDGISLTVAKVGRTGFTCAVIPQTETTTGLADKAIGAKVNIEVDMLAKYVKRFVGGYMGEPEAREELAGRRGLGDLLREFTEGR